MPSETFGLVLVEAMQFKIPVVATKWNGIPYVVDDGINGLLVEPGSSADLADKILTLVNDTSLRLKMGENGRKKFVSNYAMQKFRENMDNVFGLI